MYKSMRISFILSLSLLLGGLFVAPVYAAEGEKLKQQSTKESAHRRGDRQSGRDRQRGRDQDRHRGRDQHRGRGRDQHRGRGRDHHRGRDRHRGKPERRYTPPHRRHQRPHNYHSHLPFGFARLLIHGLEYFYHSGQFYQPYQEGFLLVTPPLGAVVATLPYGYTVVNRNGQSYYVVNNTYYLPHPQGYRVVLPPTHAPVINPVPTPVLPVQPGQSLYIYPQRGQTAEQQARDEYECHRWGVEQTGFDPSRSAGSTNAVLNQEYRRAMSACLEARGYTVK